MSDKAYVAKIRNLDDATQLLGYLREAKGDVAFINAIGVFKVPNGGFPAGTVVTLFTADRGDIMDSIRNEFGFKEFDSIVLRLEMFERERIPVGRYAGQTVIKGFEQLQTPQKAKTTVEYMQMCEAMLSQHFGESDGNDELPTERPQ